MSRPVIISCALTGGGDTGLKYPNVPVTPEQIANDAIGAAKAGAAIVHIHVRDPQTGKPTMELALYREVVERIRGSGTEVLINLTTGPGARFIPGSPDPVKPAEGTTLKTPEERVRHVVELKPDICSLDVATMNFGAHVMMNTPSHLEAMAKAIREAGVVPEIEVFDLGHLALANHMLERGLIPKPAIFQLCLGIPWGAPATTAAMAAMQQMLPAGMPWASFGISRHQFPMVAQAAVLGGHVRVGLEDNLYIEKGQLAKNNAVLVERAAQILTLLGYQVATVAQAREIIGMKGR